MIVISEGVAPMGKATISQPEVSKAIDQLARQLYDVLHKAQETLLHANGDTKNCAYRIQAGEAVGIKASLAMLGAFLEISDESKAALVFFEHHPPQLID